MKLDPFYLIVDRADWIERLVPLSVKLVQLRMKDRPDELIRAHIRRAKQVCDKYDCQLILNDHWQLAIEEGCGFIHLGQEDLSSADLDAIRTANLKLGVSTHDSEELDTALLAKPDYVAIGPVYPTILKQMKWAPQGLSRVRAWKDRLGALPLVAIGGLTPDRLEGVFKHGADSAAVVTDIMLNPDPEARTCEWIKRTAKWR